MSSLTHVTEPIPGYLLKERIGVGGYGEVWSANAPGGLLKAVKLVYGRFDDERASRELKALNRIKDVRHPFLLSLERFEIIDGQLIIVTELAEMSLKDRFEHYKAEGAGRIPRDELLGYLRDAADALDYMNDRFALQHLDVKPENLLLVGGRVKVADFGLVKELHDVTASMMGGLTPVYASPEVFDGRPSQRSDQYSLAIVFQEMLTGILPFPGKTAAQLASQHVHARPRLAPLPPRDQPIIARALLKDPSQRYANCRALVDALVGADSVAAGQQAIDGRAGVARESSNDTKSIRSRVIDTDHEWQRAKKDPRPAAPQSPNQKTLILGDNSEPLAPPDKEAFEPSADTATPDAASTKTTQIPPSAPIETAIDLEPLVVGSTTVAWRPTLFVGIGGTGKYVLRHLRRQLHDRLQGSAPAIAMLLFDTDQRCLFEATQGAPEGSIRDAETVAIPLRSTHEYTASTARSLSWLSRRWLYNIPRSQQTEGRRPLGRLAFVDHSQRVFDALRSSLAAITSPEALTATAERIGAPCAGSAPRVVVIASIGSGTGGGMALDLAFAVRTVLGELGIDGGSLHGILTYSTDRDPATSDLSIANAYACLSELSEFTSRDGFPGDPSSRLPRYDATVGPFTHTYLAHLGDRLSDEQFDRATAAVASYVYLNALTPAAAAFEMGREQADPASRGALRSFGLVRIGGQTTALPSRFASQLAGELVSRWRDGTRALDQDPAQLAEEHARGLCLDRFGLSEQVRPFLEAQVGGGTSAFLSRAREQCGAANDARAAAYISRMLSAFSQLFGAASTDPTSPPATAPLDEAIDDGLKQTAAAIGAILHDWIVALIDTPGGRVGLAARAKQWYETYFRQMESQVAEEAREQLRAAAAMEQGLRSLAATNSSSGTFFHRRPKLDTRQIDAAFAELLALRFQAASLRALVRLLRLILSSLSATGDRLAELKQALGQIASVFGLDPASNGAAPHATGVPSIDNVERATAEYLNSRLSELASTLDTRLQEGLFATDEGLQPLLRTGDGTRKTLTAAMLREARALVLKALEQVPLDQALLASAQDTAAADAFESWLRAARPQLDRCGGAQRLVAIVPESRRDCPLIAAMRGEIERRATLVTDTDSDIVLCCEAQGLQIPHVAARLVGDRGDLVQVAVRLHTRTDIAWHDLAEAPIAES